MRTGRGLVDYALQRRAALAAVASGRTSIEEACDASVYLLRAAKFHGVDTDILCPLCRKEPVTHVYWIFGDELKEAAGSSRSPAELEEMADQFREFNVYQVEVCRSCKWNHLVSGFVMGTGDERPRRRPRRSTRQAAQ